MAWLPETAPVIVPTHDDTGDDELELQRCVDVWNRARMHPWPTGPVNVSLVDDRCQVTVSDLPGDLHSDSGDAIQVLVSEPR
jgi:hypothetical protein